MIYSPSQLKNLPQSFGVYQFKDKNRNLIYIGKAINLKRRVKSYFKDISDSEKISKIRQFTNSIEVIEMSSEFETLLLEARLINLNKPKYNVIWRDDKSYIYVQITKEKYPRVLLSRKSDLVNELIGPFPSTGSASEILAILRRIFPFCTQLPPFKRVCFYHHLGLCRPCPAEIEKASGKLKLTLRRAYLSNIRNIRNILTGKSNKAEKYLNQKMNSLSKSTNFEEATEYRDKLKNLQNLITASRFSLDDYLENPNFSNQNWQAEQKALESVLTPFLDFKNHLNVLECYDISNLSGKFATGSLVIFIKGRPCKSRYRHFRIRLMDTPDDFKMLSEVFRRRFNHRQWPLPDLIMVDGGKQQLNVLLKVLGLFKIAIPSISLAKRFEEIHVVCRGEFNVIRLKYDSKALNLVKRIRDEAHRFALKYHQKLRLNYLLNSLHN